MDGSHLDGIDHFSWAARQERLLELSRLQLFWVGGAPRSGTTWLQTLLNSHPDISCRGEGFFSKQLAEPLDHLIRARGEAIAAKNKGIFAHAEGYPMPGSEETDILLATGILLALDRQRDGRAVCAIGEKTPENVFFFPRVKRLFPGGKFIGIARDPRDVLASAWHFFRKDAPSDDQEEAKIRFIRSAGPSISEGMAAMLDLRRRYPADCMLVTYESLAARTAEDASALFRFLGVADHDAIVADAIARSSFAAMSGGRGTDDVRNGSFFRGGTPGTWMKTFTPAMHDVIMRELGWSFPVFGWAP
jgi:Sulfotransferase family